MTAIVAAIPRSAAIPITSPSGASPSAMPAAARRLRWTTGGSLALGSLEQRLPASQQRLQLVASLTMRREGLDVVPVLGETALELGHCTLPLGDLRLDAFELRRRPALRRRLLGFRFLRRRRRRARLLSPAHVLGPATVVGVEPLMLDRKRPLRDRVEQRAVV